MRLRYGDHPSQFADLHLPRTRKPAGRFPVVVVIHGGFWRTRYGKALGTLLARSLVRRGAAALNIEYRRVGPDPRAGGGGWPQTALDVAAAVDLLADDQVSADRLDLSRVVALGHSAGGQLAGWLAARPQLPAGTPGADPRVRLSGFVSQAGILDLEQAAAVNLGAGAVQALLGGTPAAAPGAYRAFSPLCWPADVPFVLVHGGADTVVPISQSERYLAAAAAHRAAAGLDPLGRLVRLNGAGHRELIVPFRRGWRACRAAVWSLL